MAGSNVPGSLGTAANRPVIDAQTSARTAMPRPESVGRGGDRTTFEREFDLLKAEVANAGATGAWEGAIRAQYTQSLRAFRADIEARVASGAITWEQAATEARNTRDEVMQILRRRSTPVGRAMAQAKKATSPDLNALVADRTLRLFGPDARFANLTAAQRNQVYAAVVESAGRDNARFTAMAERFSHAGRALLFLSLAISVYTIATAENKPEAALHEGAITAAGIGGGMAGGALAGLACGPGAPVCVTIGAFVGGALAAFGVDHFWKR